MKNALKIVLVIIATLVGAGFASGKEIYTFFFVYGKCGLIGILLSSIIISIVIYKVFEISSKNNIESYQDFCNYILTRNSKITRNLEFIKKYNLLNNIVNIFLLITFYIMISGFSSFLWQEFGITKLIGSTIAIILCYLIFRRNISGLIKISNYLVPVLIIFIAFISFKNINTNAYSANIFNTNISFSNGVNAIIKSVLYASYNCIILIPVLIPLKTGNGDGSFFQFQTEKKKEFCRNMIAVITALMLIFLSFAIYNLLLQGNNAIFNLEMPIIEIVKQHGHMYKNIYQLIIGISIITSAISTGCGVLNNCSKNQREYARNLILMCVSAIFISQISFSTMINILYPMLGIFGLFEIFLLF